ncbi:protein SIEVE ELEMENT OCCLUSION B-like [Quillaja saponaria]|uniref:Protein SIEVE ELEMENT OCCLUSION B-like n=1 Tax=Quillaja saponaria TaxID=32244 RepID=A0AAD7QEN7_QUISA|nr:protein SIEVE ELEMENT OCCLUSION B-like [Quillaja saponaria]
MSSSNGTNIVKELLPARAELLQARAPGYQQQQQQQLQHADHQAALINPFHIADDKLVDHIYGYYVHSTDDQKPVDLVSLFGLVKSILKHSIHVVDNIVLGTSTGATQLQFDERIPPSSFNSPYCTLRDISTQLTCKPLSEEKAHTTTISILNKLRSYSWEAKAILTLAAFAVDYGEFALLAEVQSSDHLAKLLATLTEISRITLAKRFTTSQPLLQQRDSILIILKELNGLINLTLQVVDSIFELERLSNIYDKKEVPELSIALQQIPVDVYWAIISIVISATQVNCLTCDVTYKQEFMFYYAQKLSNIRAIKLKRSLNICKEKKGEVDAYRNIVSVMQKPTEIAEVLRVLLFPQEVKRPQFYDGSAKELVDVDLAVRTKDVLIFISILDDIDDEILSLKEVDDYLKTSKNDHQYKILWIPIVDPWNETQKNKFENLRLKMPWYVADYFSYKPGQRYINEDWQFKKDPIVVVMNPRGKVVSIDAMPLIRVWGGKAFPFDEAAFQRLNQANWIEPIMVKVDPRVTNLIKIRSYIFFYGGVDKDCTQRFNYTVQKIGNDPIINEDPIIKDERITIVPIYIGGGIGVTDHAITTRFWSNVENLFLTKINQTEIDRQGTKEVQRLLTYRSEPGWAVLSKGPNVKVIGHGNTMLKALDDFEKWKGLIPSKGFERTFKEFHDQKISEDYRCSYLYIMNIARKIPDYISCETCSHKVAVCKLYQCCHGYDGADGNLTVAKEGI